MRIDTRGDLFAVLDDTDPAVTAVGHGVNLCGVMGAGIAPLFARRFPGLLEGYRDACADGSLAIGGVHPHRHTDGRWVYNCATQVRPGRDARLDAIEAAVGAALAHAAAHGVTELLLPRIGAGIGGLGWDDVSGVLDGLAGLHDTVDVHVVTLPGT